MLGMVLIGAVGAIWVGVDVLLATHNVPLASAVAVGLNFLFMILAWGFQRVIRTIEKAATRRN